MRPAAGNFEPQNEHLLSDRHLVQLVAALGLLLPHAAFVLSTRESPYFRDSIFSLGFTNMSAGSSTEPGAYNDYYPTPLETKTGATWRAIPYC